MSNPTVNLADPAQLTAVLRMLSQPDTEIIRRGEKILAKWIKDPSAISALLNQITSCEDVSIRQLASLLLKKKITVLFGKLNRSAQEELKTVLLNVLLNEPNKMVTTALAGVVASLSKTVLSTSAWPELFNLLMTLAQDQREQMRCLCFNIIGQLSEHVVDHLKSHAATLAQMFILGCKDSANSVAVEALASTAAFISALAEQPEVMHLQGVIRPMLDVMAACLASGSEEIVAEGLDVIQECCVSDQPLINDHVEVIVPFVVEIMQSSTYEDQVKQAAGQTLMNILEYRPKLVAKKNLVGPVLSSLVDMIAKSEVGPGALYAVATQNNHLNEDDDDDEDYNSEVEVQQLAQTCLDTMAISIPSKYFSQPALNLCAQCLESHDAHRRKAGCAVLGVIAEGCRDIIRQSLSQILPRLLSAVQDPEYFVRESACFALGQFSEHCQPEILYYHQSVLPVVFVALEDSRPTVQGTSCYVLEMFCENLQPDTLRPFLPALVGKFSQLLLSPQKNTQEMCLAALAATSVAAELDFLPYAEGICSIIAPMIFETEPMSFPVRGRALECLGHIAVAIGPQHFARYFDSGMQSAKQGLELGDVALKEYSYVFIANCAKVMTRAFDPFLVQLVPYLLEVITENELYQAPEDDDNEEEEEEDLDSEGDESAPGDYRINVNDGFINSKKAAITAVGTLAEHTKEAFFPFLEETINCLVASEMGAMNSFHGIVRGEAVGIMQHLVSVACAKYGPRERPAKGVVVPLNEIVAQVVKVCLNSFLYTIEEDTERHPVAMACEGICGLLESVGMAALVVTDDEGKAFVAGVMAGIKKLLSEKSKCQTAAKFENDDDDDDDDHDNVVMDSVSDLIGQLAKSIGPEFEPYFASFHPLLMKFSKPTRPYTDRSMAIGCYAEVIAEIGPLSLKYVDAVLPMLQAGLADPMEAVRRNAAFCVGVLVQATGTALADKWMVLLQWLHPLCSRNAAQQASDVGGADIDNAISAVARMITVAQSHLPLDRVLPVMLDSLPLRSDYSEGDNIYGCLSKLIVAGEPTSIGLLPRLLSAFAETFYPSSKATDETKAIVKSCLTHISTSAQHQQLFRAALAQLPSDVVQTVEAIISI